MASVNLRFDDETMRYLHVHSHTRGLVHHADRTALHLAAERGIQKMIKLLIDHGAGVSPVDRLGRTALHLSAQLGYGKATKLLVDGGALVSAVDSGGRTARDLAQERGMERAIQALNGEPSTGLCI